MRKYVVLLILIYFTVLCIAQPIQKISIRSVRIYPDYSTKIYNDQKAYSLEIDLENEGLKPIFFWSRAHSWYLNLILSRYDFQFYQYWKSDMPQIFVILPKIRIKHKGIILLKKNIDQISIKDLIIGYKFYDAQKFAENAYLENLNDDGRDKRMDKLRPDTIWYKIPVKYQIW